MTIGTAVCTAVGNANRNSFRSSFCVFIMSRYISILLSSVTLRIRHSDDLWKCEKTWPNHLKMFLVPVQNMPQVYSPYDVAICANASHEVPPAMPFKEETPRHPNASSPAP